MGGKAGDGLVNGLALMGAGLKDLAAAEVDLDLGAGESNVPINGGVRDGSHPNPVRRYELVF